MSIEAIEETFAALTEGLDRGLTCEPCEDDGSTHAANWFYRMGCDRCGFEMGMTVCDMLHYGLVANKDSTVLSCAHCDAVTKPFDLIKSTRKVG